MRDAAMTQPTNTTSAGSGQHLGELTTAAAIALLLAHAATVEALEHRAAEAATASVRLTAQTVLTWSARTWTTRYGSLDARIDPGQWADLRPIVIREVRAAVTQLDPAPVVLAHAHEAFVLGVQQAATDLAVPTPTPAALAAGPVQEAAQPRIDTRRARPLVRDNPTVSVPVTRHPLSPEVEQLAKNATTAVQTRYARAERLLEASPVETHAELVQALSPVQAAVSDVERDTRTVVNAAVNEATQRVAQHHGADLLWFSERDACLTCTALAGTVVGPDEDFPLAASYGTRPTEWWSPPGVTLLRPPRHPRCRCRCEPWLGHDGPGLSLPEVLRREAQRAVLKGWSRPSESEQLRVRAAERLLARGSTLPKSVQAAAREAVRRREFVSRDVPQVSGR